MVTWNGECNPLGSNVSEDSGQIKHIPRTMWMLWPNTFQLRRDVFWKFYIMIMVLCFYGQRLDETFLSLKEHSLREYSSSLAVTRFNFAVSSPHMNVWSYIYHLISFEHFLNVIKKHLLTVTRQVVALIVCFRSTYIMLLNVLHTSVNVPSQRSLLHTFTYNVYALWVMSYL